MNARSTAPYRPWTRARGPPRASRSLPGSPDLHLEPAQSVPRRRDGCGAFHAGGDPAGGRGGTTGGHRCRGTSTGRSCAVRRPGGRGGCPRGATSSDASARGRGTCGPPGAPAARPPAPCRGRPGPGRRGPGRRGRGRRASPNGPGSIAPSSSSLGRRVPRRPPRGRRLHQRRDLVVSRTVSTSSIDRQRAVRRTARPAPPEPRPRRRRRGRAPHAPVAVGGCRRESSVTHTAARTTRFRPSTRPRLRSGSPLTSASTSARNVWAAS